MHNSSFSSESLYAIGEQSLSSGQIAVVMAAGGISSRMRGGAFRGNIPVGPLTGRTLFRLQGEKVLALRRLYNANLIWIVVTSAQNHEETLQAFCHEGLQGAAEFVRQDSLPAMNTDSTPYSEGGGTVLVPTGHGGIFTALARDGVIAQLISRGVTDLFIFQFPNVLELICDPSMLGFHRVCKHDISLKGFRCLSRSEKVGRIIEGDRVTVREYHYPLQNPGKYLANMGTYLINTEFLWRCQESGVLLPWHKVPLQLPGRQPLWRSEQFIFDLLAFTQNAGAFRVSRTWEYATIKQPEGQDSPRTARRALLRTYRAWLRQAGAKPETPRALVEIAPAFALDSLTVCKKIALGTVYSDGTVFQ